MLALKNKATNSLLRSEKKSLLRFLTLYVAMVIFLITLLSLFYYQSQEKLMLSDQRAMLTKYAYIQTRRLKVLHHFFPERVEYPRDPRFKSAIYDLEHMKIFSLLEDENVRFDAEEIYITNGHIHLVKMLDEFYLGTKYLVIEVKDSGAWRGEIWKNIITYGMVVFIFFMLFGLYLAKLFLKPMRDSIVLLDRFIKDTTHELNTPLSAILANIEMMDTDVMVEKNKTKLARINIAAKTVSVLYKDLTYLMLEEDQQNHDEEIEIKELIYNRVEYFSVLAQSKHIAYDLDLEESTIMMDRRKLTRVIDNLISNAIKYNKRNGTIGIRSREGLLVVWDTGIGIHEEKVPYIFDRYMRFNNSEGGFGIGLSIVKKIVDEYHISIEVDSKEGEGTKMVLRW
ncbi:HAMP domain-containing sensor histidine kinase [Sulfurovum sp. XTW-4]|uniref:histidine kinase n=1 Tax=Sulfurovum xiamenensis TaxID=3019066 RepID=A0ABT7QRB2_9BACT|nr:HAMP domain-containing sensor histidine kinase [Sulfurovum xiamenensis]MDM5263638.1 HAMP domain-containing sensor histidine kinase [Sulfurovum xiamenensis]